MNSKTKMIAISAMLVALGMVYTVFMFTFDLGIWSFTPFSHIFIMLGTFISPYVGIFTSIGTFFGFFIKTTNPLTLMRAGSHILFVLVLVLLLKKISLNSFKNTLSVSLITAAAHSVFEIVAVFAALLLNLWAKSVSTEYIFISCGIGTFLHSVIDFYAALLLYNMLKKYRIF